MNLSHPKREPFMEVVLEDGRFARIRRITRGDWIGAFNKSPNDLNLAVAFMTVAVTTIDGEAITIKDWLAADCELTAPIVNAIDRMARDANENAAKRGVA